MSWNTIIGQQRVKDVLISTLQRDRLAQAYIFSGQQGIGKDAVAIELAKVLNCERRTNESCGSCKSCLRFQTLQHPNFSLVFSLPVGKSEKLGDSPTAKLSEAEISTVQEQISLKAQNPYHHISLSRASTIKINSIREIRKEASMTSFSEGKKVFLIIDAENLSDESSNALLKTLEEPHENVLIILTVASVDALLPTIASRCQHLRFPSLDEADIRQALQERENISAEQAGLIARLSYGSYSRALRLIGSDMQERRQQAVEFLRITLYKPRKDLLQVIDQLSNDYEKDALEEFLMMLQAWLRDSMLLRDRHENILNVDDQTALRKFSAHYPSINYAAIFDAIDQSISLLGKNVYIQLNLLTLALTLQRIISSSREYASAS